MKFANGFAFPDADTFMVGELKWDGTYQIANYRRALEFVTDRSCAVDCGAHVGAWTKAMAGDFARVVAVEPSPDTFEALLVNVQAFHLTNVEPHQVALGAESGSVSMTLDARGVALANTGARFVQDGGDIPRVRLDDWQLPSLGFLKIDAEGSEPFVLQGAADTIARCRPIILFEKKWLWTKHYGLPKAIVTDWLTAQGYRYLASSKNDDIWGPR